MNTEQTIQLAILTLQTVCTYKSLFAPRDNDSIVDLLLTYTASTSCTRPQALAVDLKSTEIEVGVVVGDGRFVFT